MGERDRPYDRPPDFMARVLPITKGEERFAGNGTEASETGGGDSRDLLTQSGQQVALSQGTPLTEGYVYTISFDVIAPTDDVGDPVPYACVVQVRFNENGNTQQRIFSLSGAQSISLPGRIIDIRVTDTTPTTLPLSGGDEPTPTPGAGTPYTVRMVLERGNRPGGADRPALYNGIFQLAPTDSVSLMVPQGAGAQSVAVSYGGATPADVPSAILISFNGPGGTGIFKQAYVTAASEDRFINIPSSATEVTITNVDSANTANVSVQWGIDG